MVPHARLATCSVRSEENQENSLVKCVAGPGMGYGAHILPFLLHAEATAMRATCCQMCFAMERKSVWPTLVAVTRLDLSGNAISDAGAAALAAQIQVCSRVVMVLVALHSALQLDKVVMRRFQRNSAVQPSHVTNELWCVLAHAVHSLDPCWLL